MTLRRYGICPWFRYIKKRWHNSLLTEKNETSRQFQIIAFIQDEIHQFKANKIRFVCRLWNENALVFVCACVFFPLFLLYSVHIINLHLFDVSKRIFKYFVSFSILCVGDICCCCSSLHSFNGRQRIEKKKENIASTKSVSLAKI